MLIIIAHCQNIHRESRYIQKFLLTLQNTTRLRRLKTNNLIIQLIYKTLRDFLVAA